MSTILDTFLIGKQYRSPLDDDRLLDERNKDYKRLQAEIRKKLGIEDGWLPYFGPYEVAEYDGHFYLRSLSFGCTYFIPLSSWRPEYDDPPSDGTVLCPCGNKSFHISNGNHECLATCTNCGLEHIMG